ncbi:MAG TPA: hypothetical protein VMF55_04385 [Solirubrobacterales bacterium]|nr:hypothetical protein [Solirubrobacterales bacterium]
MNRISRDAPGRQVDADDGQLSRDSARLDGQAIVTVGADRDHQVHEYTDGEAHFSSDSIIARHKVHHWDTERNPEEGFRAFPQDTQKAEIGDADLRVVRTPKHGEIDL